MLPTSEDSYNKLMQRAATVKKADIFYFSGESPVSSHSAELLFIIFSLQSSHLFPKSH